MSNLESNYSSMEYMFYKKLGENCGTAILGKIAGTQVRNTILGEECTSAIFHTLFFAKRCGIQAPKNSVRRLAVPVQFVLFQYSMSKSGNIILSISRFSSVHSAYQPVILNIPVPKFSESIGLFNHDTHQALGRTTTLHVDYYRGATTTLFAILRECVVITSDVDQHVGRPTSDVSKTKKYQCHNDK